VPTDRHDEVAFAILLTSLKMTIVGRMQLRRYTLPNGTEDEEISTDTITVGTTAV